MRKSRFTESQIVQILAEYNAGASMEELARRNGVCRRPCKHDSVVAHEVRRDELK